jgi:DNA-directed RNA polymerase subunit RPC12/RpoP
MSTGQTAEIRQRALRCQHCGRGRFVSRRAQLNTALLEFFDLGWLNQSADLYVCTHCGLVHWFVEPQVRAEEPATEEPPVEERPAEDDLTEATECLACHQSIPAGTAKCPACGWSYR